LLIERNEQVTRSYFYKQCYPLFKSIYDRFYTDCDSCLEFISEIYLVVLAPSVKTGKCQMENFRGDSTLTSWLKTACLYYCYAKYEEKQKLPLYEKIHHFGNDDEEAGDRNDVKYGTIELDFNNLNRKDAMTIINMMPNKRYGNLIKLRYLEQKSNEETAEALGMTMDNYYNKHKLAKAQYGRYYIKEAQNA